MSIEEMYLDYLNQTDSSVSSSHCDSHTDYGRDYDDHSDWGRDHNDHTDGHYDYGAYDTHDDSHNDESHDDSHLDWD